MRNLTRAAALCLAVGGWAAGGQALASQGHIQFYSGSTGETFTFNPAAGYIDGDYLVFQTTGDSLGETAVFFGDSNVQGEFGTGTFDIANHDVSATFQIDYFDGGSIVGGPFSGACCAHSPLFNGTDSAVQASANTTLIGALSSQFSFTSVPEASTWALLLTGFGALGAALRFRARGLRTA